MSGPIVRSAPNKQFTQNWETAFGGKKSAAKSKATSAPKAAKKKAAKKKKS